MWILIVALIVLGTIAAGVSLLLDKNAPVTYSADCTGCTGVNAKCEQECKMETAIREIEYFDDEELDEFKGRAAEAYTEEETEQFRQVMETMNTDELKAWNRSLTLRGVDMPDGIKDEFILLVGG